MPILTTTVKLHAFKDDNEELLTKGVPEGATNQELVDATNTLLEGLTMTLSILETLDNLATIYDYGKSNKR